MMETKSYTNVDREGWPPGPWDGEPDKLQWPDTATGLPCLAVRHPQYGHWCGYVGVPPGHPWYGVDWSEPCVEVHGGLTFANRCQEGFDEGRGVCHVAPGEPEPYWLGFDCAHAWDESPQDAARWGINKYGEYRTLDYVQQQCGSLAAQIAAAAEST